MSKIKLILWSRRRYIKGKFGPVAGFCTGVDGHSDPGKDLFNLVWLKTNDQI